jgi:hypothetical protein
MAVDENIGINFFGYFMEELLRPVLKPIEVVLSRRRMKERFFYHESLRLSRADGFTKTPLFSSKHVPFPRRMTGSPSLSAQVFGLTPVMLAVMRYSLVVVSLHAFNRMLFHELDDLVHKGEYPPRSPRW